MNHGLYLVDVYDHMLSAGYHTVFIATYVSHEYSTITQQLSHVHVSLSDQSKGEARLHKTVVTTLELKLPFHFYRVTVV